MARVVSRLTSLAAIGSLALVLVCATAARAAPVASISSPQDGTQVPYGASATADFSCADDAGAIASCDGSLDGAPIATGAPLPTGALGPHALTVKATNEAGETAQAVARYAVVDVTPPSVAISSPVDGGIYARGEAVVASYSCADDVAAPSCSGTVPSGARVDTATLGTHGFQVQAVDGAGHVVTVARTYRVVDGSAPTIALRSPPAGAVRTYEQGSRVAADYGCVDDTDPAPLCQGTVPAGAALDTATAGVHAFTVVARDAAGNQSAAGATYRVADRTAPSEPSLTGPADGVTTNRTTPTFSWAASGDGAGSGVDRYEVFTGTAGGSLARAGSVPAATTTFTPAAPLPVGRRLEWFVRAVDRAGNARDSLHRTFTVDPAAPNPPTLTGGPAGPTNAASVTFTWTGLPGARFSWRILGAGDRQVQGASAVATGQATSAPLPDGRYKFEVTQTDALGNGLTGDAAVILFSVDTAAPAPPRVVAGPDPAASSRTPTFAWTGEPGGSYVWCVLTAAGAEVRLGGTNATGAAVQPALDPGALVFRVRQVDDAGNASDWSAPFAFTVAGTAPAPGAAAAASTGAPHRAAASGRRPATRNARLLRPAAGTRVRTLTPVLSWRGKPRGTRLFNVQIFLGARKVLSAFPRGQRFTVPRGVMKPGGRYTWRVWPYRGKGKGFTSAPLGVSWLAVAAGARATAPRTPARKAAR